jgi:glycine oxidase
MPDLVVVGGGAIGLAIAWRASDAGLEVVVMDPEPGRGASWAAAGLLAPITEVHYGEEALLAFNLHSARLYPDFIAELRRATDLDPGYRRCGTLMVAADADENAALDDVFKFQIELGLAATRLRSKDCRDLEPGLAPSVRGGILVEDDHQIDNRALVTALLEACVRGNVTFVTERAREVVTSAESVSAVRTKEREIAAPVVVLAAGCGTPSIGNLPPEAVIVRPVKGQLLHLRSRGGAPFTAHNVRGRDVYLVARNDGRVVVGATVEEMGFHSSVTAGAVQWLLDEVRRLLPDVDELDFVEATAGLRPGTPDNAPLIGRTSVDGLLVATGHYRNGILLTPATAEAMVRLVVDGATPPEISAFDPLRFHPAGVA